MMIWLTVLLGSVVLLFNRQPWLVTAPENTYLSDDQAENGDDGAIIVALIPLVVGALAVVLTMIGPDGVSQLPPAHF